MEIILSRTERLALEKLIKGRKTRADLARRARLIVLLADGFTWEAIQALLGCSTRFIRLWPKRFMVERLAGLYSRHEGRAPLKRTAQLEARILAKTRRKPRDGSTHWSTRKLATELGISHMMVARVWQRAGLAPHRLERYLASDDPHFEKKAADIIGLYLHPPQHAAVFCVDEKTAIQALDRLDPVLPLSPGRAERHGFEYYRHGTLSLYAALNTHDGQVLGRTVDHHTSIEFVGFLHQVVASQPSSREIHVILDNLSAHKSAVVQDFLTLNPRVHLHFTPTYSSWLNQVELWFSKIEREVIARGIFSSKGDLARKLLRYIRLYNTRARPFRWSYSNPRHRIKSTDLFTVTGH